MHLCCIAGRCCYSTVLTSHRLNGTSIFYVCSEKIMHINLLLCEWITLERIVICCLCTRTHLEWHIVGFYIQTLSYYCNTTQSTLTDFQEPHRCSFGLTILAIKVAFLLPNHWFLTVVVSSSLLQCQAIPGNSLGNLLTSFIKCTTFSVHGN